MVLALSATIRKEQGRQAKQVRQAGKIPAIVYGHGIAPQAVSLSVSEFRKVYGAAGGSSLIDVKIDETAAVKALIQEVQVHPLTMSPIHVDLRQVKMDEELTVEVPLKFIGESPAVKELAGTLVHPYESLSVRCLPADLPHEIEVDLSRLKTFDDMITVADLLLPKGVTVLQAADVTIATVTPPMTEEQLKRMEEEAKVDVTAVKTEAEEKKAAEEAAKAEEETVKEA